MPRPTTRQAFLIKQARRIQQAKRKTRKDSLLERQLQKVNVHNYEFTIQKMSTLGFLLFKSSLRVRSVILGLKPDL